MSDACHGIWPCCEHCGPPGRDGVPFGYGDGHPKPCVKCQAVPVPLDPFDPTVIAPGLAAIPLTPTPWDDLPDGQHAVTPDGTVWQRRNGLWHRHPWWQGSTVEETVAVCADPDEYAYDLGWTRKHVEESVGSLTPITLPGSADAC